MRLFTRPRILVSATALSAVVASLMFGSPAGSEPLPQGSVQGKPDPSSQLLWSRPPASPGLEWLDGKAFGVLEIRADKSSVWFLLEQLGSLSPDDNPASTVHAEILAGGKKASAFSIPDVTVSNGPPQWAKVAISALPIGEVDLILSTAWGQHTVPLLVSSGQIQYMSNQLRPGFVVDEEGNQGHIAYDFDWKGPAL